MTVQDEIKPKNTSCRLEVDSAIGGVPGLIWWVAIQHAQAGQGILSCSWTGPGYQHEELARINRMVVACWKFMTSFRGLHPGGVVAGPDPGLENAGIISVAWAGFAEPPAVTWEGRQVHSGILQGLEDGQVSLKGGNGLYPFE
jgi:hypothetical protein